MLGSNVKNIIELIRFYSERSRLLKKVWEYSLVSFFLKSYLTITIRFEISVMKNPGIIALSFAPAKNPNFCLLTHTLSLEPYNMLYYIYYFASQTCGGDATVKSNFNSSFLLFIYWHIYLQQFVLIRIYLYPWLIDLYKI